MMLMLMLTMMKLLTPWPPSPSSGSPAKHILCEGILLRDSPVTCGVVPPFGLSVDSTAAVFLARFLSGPQISLAARKEEAGRSW